jgi:effector-binding domain-containing protein
MKYEVVVETAQAELVAAVRAIVSISEIARAWKPALDQVWSFLKQSSELAPGHNLFLYHHPDRRNEPMDIDFGVQVGRPFEREGNVRCIKTPTGEVARTVHVGPYDRLRRPQCDPRLVCREQPENRAGFVGKLRRLE